MQRIFNRISPQPIFIVLIPVFFVLHGYLYFFGLIKPAAALLLALNYCFAAVVLFIVLWLLYKRNVQKAGLLSGFLLMAFFFFGAYHDFLLTHMPAISHYSVLLSILLCILIILLWVIRKKPGLVRVIIWLNLIFSVYIIIDCVGIAINYVRPPSNKFNVTSSGSMPFLTLDKPDIYFLIFDEYASSASLNENYGYKNDLDAYLLQNGFKIMPASISNYHFTTASVASILNMSFINGLQDTAELTIKDMNYCIGLIKDNAVIKLLSSQGYRIVNCSDFDLLNNPSDIYGQLPVKTRLITASTLWSKLNKDVFGNIKWAPFANLYLEAYLRKGDVNNLQLLKMVKQQTTIKTQQPVFVFSHLNMPHNPFYYDKNNQLRDRKSMIGDPFHPDTPYLEYLTHVNLEIKKLLDTIQQNTNRKAVIIVMGDHGFRGRFIGKKLRRNYQNLNAVYLPGGNYHLFYDSISGVNQFKIVFNTLFNQSIPLQKDSTIFLRPKEEHDQ